MTDKSGIQRFAEFCPASYFDAIGEKDITFIESLRIYHNPLYIKAVLKSSDSCGKKYQLKPGRLSFAQENLSDCLLPANICFTYPAAERHMSVPPPGPFQTVVKVQTINCCKGAETVFIILTSF
ncbi:MAG: hypothetical protein GY950_33120, partial [bacterium]|nr:hypothetical protein [bacterium]